MPRQPRSAPRRRRLAAAGRSLEITRAGYLLSGLAVLVGFAAMNSGAALLHAVLGAMLAMVLGSGVFSERALQGVHVELHLRGDPVQGSPCELVVALHNDSPHAAIAVTVEIDPRDPVAPVAPCELRGVFALRVQPGARATLVTTLRCDRRGRQPMPRIAIATRFPFGLFVKRRYVQPEGELVVLPASTPTALRATPDVSAGQVSATTGAGLDGVVHALRPYRDGDAVAQIDWKATARGRGLIARERERERRTRVRVELTRGAVSGSDAHAATFERALREAAYRVREAAAQGDALQLVIDGQLVIDAADAGAVRHAALRALALIDDPAEARAQARTRAATLTASAPDPAAAPLEAPSEAPSEAPAEAPAEASSEASSEAPAEAPAEGSSEAPAEAPSASRRGALA